MVADIAVSSVAPEAVPLAPPAPVARRRFRGWPAMLVLTVVALLSVLRMPGQVQDHAVFWMGILGAIGWGLLIGIVTDGDIRRHLAKDLLTRPVAEVMTRNPKTVPPECLVGEALAMMNMTPRPFTVVFVVEEGRPAGIVHMHDFLRIGVA